MRWLSRIFLVLLLAASLGTLWFLQTDTFSQKAVVLVEEALAKSEIYVSVGRLSFHPIRGLMARDLKLFEDEAKQALVTHVAEANLNMNYANALKGRWEVEGLKLTDAGITLPASPEQGIEESMEIAELSAEILMTDQFVEVKQLQGKVLGMALHVEASLLRSNKNMAQHKEDRKAREERRRQQWELWRSKRTMLSQVAQAFSQFESPTPPKLTLKIEGDISRLDKLRAQAHLEASQLKHAVYECEKLEAIANFENQYLDIPTLYIRDRLGELKASAGWQVGHDAMQFNLQSRVDLIGFMAAITKNSVFREFVVYEPLDLNVSGSLNMNPKTLGEGISPVKALGDFAFGKVLCRGEMFEGLSGKFSVGPQGVYVTDAKLKHATGGIEAQVMYSRISGIRYQGLFTMDLRAFLPFVPKEEARTLMQYFERHDDSFVHLEFQGESPDLNPANLVTRGHAEFQRVTYRGVYVPKIEGDLEIRASQQVFSNLKVYGPNGTQGTAKAVTHYPKTKSAKIDDAVANVNVADLVSCFAPVVANEIRKYKFSAAPLAKADGVVSVNPGLNTLQVSFTSSGVGYYKLLDETYEIDKPVGRLSFKGSNLHFDIKGRVFGQAMHCDGDVELNQKAGKKFHADFKGGLFPYEVFGKLLPFREVKALVKHEKGITKLDINATAFSGQVEMRTTVDERVARQPFEGEIEIRGVVFKEFAKVYSPGNDTEGDLTGHFKYSGDLGDWNSLKGAGAISLLNGNLYAVPILGPLTPLLGSILPKQIGNYNVAREADCTFTVADGHVYTQDVEAMTGVFRLVASGSVDFINDVVKMEAQAKFRGLPGFVFTPISELLEYVCEGSVSDPQWRSKYFSNSKEKPKWVERAVVPEKKVEEAPKVEKPERSPRTLWFRRKKD